MTVETAQFLGGLDATYPVTSDQIAEGAQHLRLMKAAIKATFPGRDAQDMRVIGKTIGFTPALGEVGVIFNCTAVLSVSLLAASGLPAGTHYFFKANGAAVTLVANGSDLIDAAASLVVAAGEWVLLTKFGTGWVSMKGAALLDAAALLSILGTTAVPNAINAVIAANCTGNSATATVSASCSGNAASATTAAACTGNSATATLATNATTAANATNLGGQAPAAFAAASAIVGMVTGVSLGTWDDGAYYHQSLTFTRYGASSVTVNLDTTGTGYHGP